MVGEAGVGGDPVAEFDELDVHAGGLGFLRRHFQGRGEGGGGANLERGGKGRTADEAEGEKQGFQAGHGVSLSVQS